VNGASATGKDGGDDEFREQHEPSGKVELMIYALLSKIIIAVRISYSSLSSYTPPGFI